ncbi:MAG: aspartate kinase [Anaerolineae bacterium]|nr:aspartate kinase [Anaerolineae bacterium]
MADPDAQSNKNTCKTLLLKFGGTSVGSPEAMRQAAAIIQEERPKWERIIAVVSAMNGVTNTLIACAQAALDSKNAEYQEHIAQLRQRHFEAIHALVPQELQEGLCAVIDQQLGTLKAFCDSIQVMGEVTPRGMDTISSLGERMNAKIFSACLQQIGLRSQAVDAAGLIVTDDNFQNAHPLLEQTCRQVSAKLLPLLEQGVIPVVTGFIGATEDGITTTLGRGGSDYSASLLADCLDATEVWNCTDVDGVMTADPNIVPDARVIPELTYDEMSEMAYFGAKVLHPKTIQPIVTKNIPLRVMNTFNPSHPGTRISSQSSALRGKLTSVSGIKNLSIFTIEGRGMLGVPGVAARTFGAVAEVGASVLMISQSSSEQSICFVVPAEVEEKVQAALLRNLGGEIERGDINGIQIHSDVVIITVIGSGMRQTPGVSARVFNALGSRMINVIAIAQGSSEYSISLVVDSQDAKLAIQQLHQEVIINGNKPTQN